jgi:UDP-N-acetylmuramoyl-L-alanyl-D-glutamate--2,6-diaminopimelate ligase
MTDRVGPRLEAPGPRPGEPRPGEPRPGEPLGGLIARLAATGLLIGDGSVDEGAAARVVIRGVSQDSRSVGPGDLFVAIRGLQADGHRSLGQAVTAGAAAVLVEEPSAGVTVPQIVVRDTRLGLAAAAAWWFGDPSHELTVVGVTGTNGKTTTTFLTAAALEAAGWPTGLVGTIGIRVADVMRPNDLPNTTPDAIALQGLLREMVGSGERAVVLETSSHGLAQERVAEVAYDAAIFTNLSHEHLDFHGTFEAYAAAKRNLFERLPATAKDGGPGLGVVNLDDPAAESFILATTIAGARAITYGTRADADVQLIDLEADASSSRLVALVDGRELAIDLRIGGRYNALNALAVIALAVGWDLDLEAVAGGLARLPGVPGRLEAVDRGQPFHVIVDYAHTPGSLEAITAELQALVEPSGGAVLSVFGASGERDVGKRPLMGEAAARHSRLVVVTEDDSRGEDPASIYEAVARGAEAAGSRRDDDLLIVGNRREAIREAFHRARPGDVVLIAGKGHETWNMGPHGAEPWSDRDTAEALLGEMGFASR